MLEEKIIFENEATDKVSISYPSGKLIEFVDYFCEIKKFVLIKLQIIAM